MIETQEEEWNWDVIFIGAGIDAFNEAGGIGVKSHKTMSSTADAQGITGSYVAASAATRAKHVTGDVDDTSWKDDIDDQMD